jgi:hypothetical protein
MYLTTLLDVTNVIKNSGNSAEIFSILCDFTKISYQPEKDSTI